MKPKHAGSTAVLVAALAISTAAGAASIPIGDVVTNGAFGTDAAPSLAGWTLTSTGASPNAQPSTAPVNTLGGNAGFNGFFSSAFALLGNDSAASIGGVPGAHEAATNAISQFFVLPEEIDGVEVMSYDVTISFRSVFDGKDSPLGSDPKDQFITSLDGITLTAQNSAPLPDCGPATTCPDAQITADPYVVSLFGLAPGSHLLTFTLFETADALGAEAAPLTNTAAAIDDVSATAIANIPEPGVLALLGLGFAGLAARRRRRVS
jgi:PEP-CTERM motif